MLVEYTSIVSNDNVAIFLENSRMVFRDSLISDNPGIGIYAYGNSNLEIYNSELRNNRDLGLWISNSRVVVDSTVFSGNGSSNPYAEAVSILGASSVVTLTNNTLQNNSHHPIKVEAGALPGMHLSNNTFSGNNPRSYPHRRRHHWS